MVDGQLDAGQKEQMTTCQPRGIVVSKQKPEYYFMKFQMEVEDDFPDMLKVDVEYLKVKILEILTEVFGDSGAAIPFDVLQFNSTTREGIIRILSSGFVQVRSCLTIMSDVCENRCRINVLKVSPYLVSLSKNSRLYQHKVVPES